MRPDGKALPGADRLVKPWIIVAIGSAILMFILHKMNSGRTYEPVERWAQAGDEVEVQMPFVCQGRFWGSQGLDKGTRGVILDHGVQGDYIVRFKPHRGQFRVTREHFPKLAWYPRQRTLRPPGLP